MKEKFVTIRMPIEIYNKVKTLADKEVRSVSSQIIYLMNEALKK